MLNLCTFTHESVQLQMTQKIDLDDKFFWICVVGLSLFVYIAATIGYVVVFKVLR